MKIKVKFYQHKEMFKHNDNKLKNVETFFSKFHLFPLRKNE